MAMRNAVETMNNTIQRARGRAAYFLLLVPYCLFLAGCDTVFTTPEGIAELATPVQPTVLPGERKMVVSWTNISTAIGWELWWANGETGDRSNWTADHPQDKFETNTEKNTVQITMTGLSVGYTYYVWVRAIYKRGVSGFSDRSEQGVPLLKPENPIVSPTGALSAGDNYFIAQWMPDDFRGPSQYYDLYYSPANNWPGDNDVSLSISDDSSKNSGGGRWAIATAGLTNNKKYYVWVRSRNTAGNSEWVSMSDDSGNNYVTPIAGSPSPTDTQYIRDTSSELEPHSDAFALTWGNKRITVEWRPFTKNSTNATGTNPDVSRYKVYYTTWNGKIENWDDPHLIEAAQSAGAKYIPIRSNMSVTLSGLENMKRCYIYIRTGNSTSYVDANGKCVNWSENISDRISDVTDELPRAKPTPTWSYNRFQLCETAEEFANYEYGMGDRLSRKYETAYSDLVGDALAWWARIQGYEVDFAFYNGGLITDGIPKGTVTIADVRGSITTGTRAAIVQLTGSQVRALSDYAADTLHDGSGSTPTEAFPQVSAECTFAIDYTYGVLRRHGFINWGTDDEVKISGEPIDDNRVYTIVTSRAMLAGASGYGAYLYSDDQIKTTYEIWQAVAEYMWDIWPPILRVSNFRDGRIRLINEDWSELD